MFAAKRIASSHDDRVPFGPRWLLTTARVLLVPSVKRMHQTHSRRLSPIECRRVATMAVLPLSHVLAFERNSSAPVRLARFDSPWVSPAGKPPWPSYPHIRDRELPLGWCGEDAFKIDVCNYLLTFASTREIRSNFRVRPSGPRRFRCRKLAASGFATKPRMRVRFDGGLPTEIIGFTT
jgi:hypothetical protein